MSVLEIIFSINLSFLCLFVAGDFVDVISGPFLVSIAFLIIIISVCRIGLSTIRIGSMIRLR